MESVRYITEDIETYKDCMKKRCRDPKIIDNIDELRTTYVKTQYELNQKIHAKKLMSKLISGKYQLTDEQKVLPYVSLDTDPSIVKEHIKMLTLSIDESTIKVKDILTELKKIVSSVPNLLHDNVPIDNDEEQNRIERKYGDGTIRKPLDQYQLCTKFNLIQNVPQLSGNRGYMMLNDLVRLNYALMNYGLDFMAQRGFTIYYTPHFMNESLMSKVCQLSEFDDTLYKIGAVGKDDEDKYLIATSEQILTAYNGSKTFADLPVKQCGVSTCFRKEAGSHGKDTLGIFRVHQFEKVEQFCITDCDSSWDMMEYMITNAEDFYKSLGIEYRIINMVSGALNNAAAMKYDLEGWFPGSGKYRELVSCSNTTDYFSRRLKIHDSKGRYVHMLNSTLFANTRTLCCILETYQNEDHISVPNVLIPYFGKDVIKIC